MQTCAPGGRTRSALRGRDPELAAIGELLAAAVAGRGSALVLDGGAGVGKTRLLTEAAVMARRNAMRVAAGRPRSRATAMPFSFLLEPLLGGDRPLLRSGALHELGAGPNQRYWLVEQLRGLLEEAARRRPLLIALDDLHRADDETLTALRTLTAGLRDAPVGWLFATRAAEPGAAVRATIDELVLTGARRMAVADLSDAAAAEVTEDLLDGRPDTPLTRLAARAGGNPLVLVELLDGLVEDGLVRNESGRIELLSEGPPRRLCDGVRGRVGRLGAETGRMVRLASILGRFSVEHVAAMLDVSAAALLGPVEEALGADLLVEDHGELAFRHEPVRDALVATLPRSMRRSLHRQAADVLLAAGADPLIVATHLTAGAAPGDRAAVAGLRKAAWALAGAHPDRAAELAMRALDLTVEDDPSRAELVAEAVFALDAAMRADEAEALAAAELEPILRPEQEAEIRLSLASFGPRPAHARAAHNARALALDGLSPVMRARHLALQAQNTALAGSAGRTAALVPAAAEAARSCRDQTALDAVDVAQVALDEARGDYARALELACEVRELARTPASAAVAGARTIAHLRLLAATGNLGDALDLSSAAARRAHRDGQAWLLACLNALRAHLLLDAGALRDARVEGERALSAPGDPAGSAAVLAVGRVALHTGDLRRLRLAIRRARDRRRDPSPAIRRDAAWLLALSAFQDRRPQEAVAFLEDGELPYAIPSVDVGHAPAVVRMALAAGEHTLAKAAVAGAEDRVSRNPRNALLAGLAAHARALLAGGADDVLRAARLLQETGRPLVLAAALEDASRAFLAAGRRAEARRSGGEALDAWERAGASADTRRLRRHLRTLGIRRGRVAETRPKQGWESLTEAELGVVSLVAAGHTNREVAGRLVVSPHTVNTHLRHAFAKLRINSRVELARMVLDRDLDGAPTGAG